jgi:GTP pyrophosphokinase
MYQDRIFAFTPKGALFQLPKGATPVDFAFAVHTNLGAAAVGAKINGRHVPLRTPLTNGDVVEIIRSRTSEPQLSWLSFAVTGKARAAIRRAVRQKERADIVAIGRKLYEEIVGRLPTKIGKKALGEAIKRLKFNNEDELMMAIGQARVSDRQVMEALVPGSAANLPQSEDWPQDSWPRQQRAIAVRGLSPGAAFKLALCCHPVPGDRIVGLRRPGMGVEVHSIDCLQLANGVDADWIDLSWETPNDGAVGRLRAELYNRPGTLAEMAGIFGKNHANVVNLEMTQRENPFHTYMVDLEVRDLAHLTRIISALRASDAVAQAERM